MEKRTVWIGTSGWVYKEWAGNFYPRDWPKKSEFSYYVRHFPTVEINATFYRLPSKAIVRGWYEKAPVGFLFAIKGSRYLTHIRRLKDTSHGLQKYFRRLTPLAERAGPVLWQLPPSLPKTAETFRRLDRFLSKLPTTYRHSVEFRHPSWMDEQTMELLREYRAANVWLSSLRMPVDYSITSDFVYLRFHGLGGGAYHDYTEAELKPWAGELTKAAQRGLSAFVYFNNDLNTRAPLNAAALMSLVEPHTVAPQSQGERPPLPVITPVIPKPETWPGWKDRAKTSPAAPKNARGQRPRGAPTYTRTNQPMLPPAEGRAGPPARRRRDK